MVLTEFQFIIIGVVALLFAEIFKFIWRKWKNEQPDRKIVTVVVYIPALVMAFFWARPEMPVFPDPVADPSLYAQVILTFAGQLISVAAAIVGAAMTIYNLLKEKVYERLGW